MRNKNIYCALPVEEIPETNKSCKTVALELSPKHVSRKKRQINKTKEIKTTVDSTDVSEFSKLSISKMTENSDEKLSSFAKITHKKITGANNWTAFLENNKTANVTKNTKNVNDEFSVSSDDEDSRARRKRANHIVAIDCEMVGIGDDGEGNMLARVSVVNSLGECLYDTFVKPTEPVINYRTAVSGVRPSDLVNAEEFSVAQSKVLKLLSGKILVGHAIHNDLSVLKIRHPRYKIRDTTHYRKFYQIGSGTPSLKKLTSHFLHVDIQCGEHNSIQDAQAAMQLYMLFRKEWEAEQKKRYRAYLQRHENHSTKKKSKSSHKPKRFSKNYKK